nr:unnamed protein product [Callosobruchus chinensis]
MFVFHSGVKLWRYCNRTPHFSVRCPLAYIVPSSRRNWSTSVKNKERLRVTDFNDLVNFIKAERQFYLKLLTNVFHTVDFENISREDAILLLNCCGNSVVDSSLEARDRVCQDIYKNLLKHNKLDLSVYNKYIEICTENGTLLNAKEFLESIKCRPSQDTIKLLFRNICEKGSTSQAFHLLELMKEYSFPVDEDIFSYLILAHVIESGLNGAEMVLKTMRAAQIVQSHKINLAILRGVAKANNHNDFLTALEKYAVQLNEVELLDILKNLAVNGNSAWIEKIEPLYSHIPMTKEFVILIKGLCIHLVHLEKSEEAFKLYEYFVKPHMDKNYAYFLLREMLHAKAATTDIIKIAKYLKDNNLNEYCIQNLTEIALRHNYVDVCWDLLQNLPEVRPHFFWPLLINAHKTSGEKGVADIINKINTLNVKLDFETLENYILPFFNLSNPTLAVDRLKELGFTIKQIVNAMVLVLLRDTRLKEAVALSNAFNVVLLEDKLLAILPATWENTKDARNIIPLLQKCCETSKNQADLVHEFLINCLELCSNNEDYKRYLDLLKVVGSNKLRISPASAEMLQEVASQCIDEDLQTSIQHAVNDMMEINLKSDLHTSYIPHPKDMNLEDLECHLIELKQKGLETRGVLSKLIKLHSTNGNIRRVKELQQEFEASGYKESLGTKSFLMHNYVMTGNVDEAMRLFQQIKDSDPGFNLDDFKIIDLATLLVKNDKFEDALNIMKTEINRPSSRKADRNLLELLESFTDPNQQMQMFECIMKVGYVANNVVLGPLVRIHLKNGDIRNAVKIYVQLAGKYKRTPLFFELIKELVTTKDEQLLQQTLSCSEKIHGAASIQADLIAALAEQNQIKPLEKVLISNRLNIAARLQNRCDRWVKEKKVDALKLLASYCEKIPGIMDVNYIYRCILRIHVTNNDCESALNFYNWLINGEKSITNELEDTLTRLLEQNCYEIPSSLRRKS